MITAAGTVGCWRVVRKPVLLVHTAVVGADSNRLTRASAGDHCNSAEQAEHFVVRR
jgi:hypothetical protein